MDSTTRCELKRNAYTHTERHNRNGDSGIICKIFKLKITQIYINGRMWFVHMMSCYREN